MSSEKLGAELNLRYGHQATCAFGLKNSGKCDCGAGFGEYHRYWREVYEREVDRERELSQE